MLPLSDTFTRGSADATTARTRAVIAELQIALHVLVAALLAMTVVRTLVDLRGGERIWALTLALVFGVVYVAGTVWARHRPVGRAARVAWLVVVTACWILFGVHVPDTAYLAFPLYFIHLGVLGTRWGSLGVITVAVAAVVSSGLHRGWTLPGVVGPVLAALVAVGISIGVLALHRESVARRAVIDELVATRAELAARQREAGRDAERARLAGELHDTVAQGLSSIVMLLHAVERADPERPGVDRIRLARTAAAESLAETRSFIAALRPAALEGTTLAGAVERIAERAGQEYPHVRVIADVDPVDPGVETATALVRIAREATTNALVHGLPSRVVVTLDRLEDGIALDVTDDGVGFDPGAPRTGGSFGLDGMERRVHDLGGSLEIESGTGEGTRVRVRIPEVGRG